jgi:hypothetical protein
MTKQEIRAKQAETVLCWLVIWKLSLLIRMFGKIDLKKSGERVIL